MHMFEVFKIYVHKYNFLFVHTAFSNNIKKEFKERTKITITVGKQLQNSIQKNYQREMVKILLMFMMHKI